MAARPVTDERWTVDVLGVHDTVVVAFLASGSGPCRTFGPILDELADDLRGRAKVLRLDVEENAATVRRYDVSSLPTLLVFCRGRLTGRLVGARSKERLLPELLTHLA